MSNNQKKKFNLFDWYFKNGKDNDKLDINVLEKPNIINFFKIVWKKLGKLFTANIIFIFANFPIFFFLLALSSIFGKSASAPTFYSWGSIYGTLGFESNTDSLNFVGIIGAHTQTTPLNSTIFIFFALTLLLFFTMGFAKVGTSYLYRNMMSGEAIFPLSDFWYVIRKNIKQSLIIGILDTFFIVMFAFNIYFLSGKPDSMDKVMFFLTIAMCIVYLFARPYAYIMVFTFDLKLGNNQ